MLRGNYFTLTRVGLAYLIILGFLVGGAMLRDINLLIVVAGIMLGLFILDGASMLLMMRGLRFERKHPEVVSAGDLLVVDVTAINRRWRLCSWSVALEDPVRRIESSLGDEGVGRVYFPFISPRHPAKGSYRGRIANRGYYEFGPAKVTTRFPLGLLRRTKRVNLKSRITVFPRLGQLLPAWYKTINAAHVGSQRSKSRQALMEGEFHGLRDWRSGDSRNWIHWRTSAKRGELTVRQFERHENQDMSLLLDLWQPRSASDDQLEHVETAISFVATIVADQCRRGSSRLQVGTAGQLIKSTSGYASVVTLYEIMELLAMSEAHAEDSLPHLLNEVLTAWRPDTRVVIISTRPTDLSDTERFAAVWDDLDQRAALGRILCLNVSDAEITNFYRAT